MLLSERHIIRKSSEFYLECKDHCFKSKNLYNYANYIIRNEFIKTSKEKEAGLVENANYLNYNAINKLLIKEKQFDYYNLPAKVSNQTLMMLDKNWKSFFATIKDYSKNKSKYKSKPNLPNYLNTKNGKFVVTYELGAISKKFLKHGIVALSKTNIKIKTKQTNIKQCRIIPKGNHFVIEVIYEKQEKLIKESNKRYCAIDIGVNNLATIGSNCIKPIIINGRPLKSINQYYNKKRSEYGSQLEKETKRKISKRLIRLDYKRNNKVNDYLHKSSRYIVNHLVSNDISTLIIGKNVGWKQEINIGKRNNQNFINIPHSRFIEMLLYKCKMEGINTILTEESYTSKCSFIDNEELYEHESYCGRRIKRGLFRSKDKIFINADLNGSLNILRKVVPEFKYEGIEAIAVSPIVVTL